MNKLYRIGLDIGIGSVGYAVLENDPITEEPVRIVKLGVRTFGANEVDKTGESTAKNRREKRGVRRRNRRKEFRFERIKKLLKKTFGEGILDDIAKLLNEDVYCLRAKALDEPISDAELGKVILHILKRRGFQSNRKNLNATGDDGKLLKAIKKNEQFLLENGYRTVGEAFFKDPKYRKESCGNTFYDVRNHAGDYRNCFYRSDLKKELELVLQSQKNLGNGKISDEFAARVVDIFARQRNFDEGPGEPSPYSATFEVGRCTFVPTEKRAPKASFTFQLFSALSKINNLKIDGECLTQEQKEKLYEIVKKEKCLKFSKIRELFDVSFAKRFNLCRYKLDKKSEDLTEEEYLKKCEDTNLCKMEESYSIKKALGVKSAVENADLIDEIALMLSMCKSDARIDEYIAESDMLKNLSSEQIDEIKKLSFDKFGSLSIVAMKMIMPFLLEGKRYDEACRCAGFDHSSFEKEKLKYLKGEAVEERLADVTNNVVKRSVNQTLRIVNEIIKKYGSPQFISIELARDLGKSKKDRQQIEDFQKQRAATNEEISNKLREEFFVTRPTGLDILKYRLYLEQDGKCMYSGKVIEAERLFESNYVQIDHILPFSKSMNDSFNNKVLVLADQNQNKGNRTPFEYFGSDESRWKGFLARVSVLKNKTKQRNLLKEHISEEEQKDFISRNINDTRYMSRLLLELFGDYLQMAPVKQNGDTKRKVVRSVNGAATDYLRRCWGINKIRGDGDVHHCVDAAVIATVSDKVVQAITSFNKFKERFVKVDDKFVCKTTGEVMTAEEKQEFEKQNIDTLSGKLPKPYDWFVRELAIRSTVKYDSFDFSEDEKLELTKMGYDHDELFAARPVFVSRMKTVKMTGPIHKETLMSAREYKKTKKLIKSVPISKVRVCDKMETLQLKDDPYPEKSIENYYRPEDDRLLYLKLKKHLVEKGPILATEKFYKPRKDGTDGPEVRTIKMYEVASSCVVTPNGAAANDTMHRVDVFEKNGQFFLCPVYMADVYAHRLPSKVIAIGKEWLDIDKSYNFRFSLYRNDLVRIVSKKGVKLNKNIDDPKSEKPNEIVLKDGLFYYNGTNISGGKITVYTADKCYQQPSLGVKTLLDMQKYYVDIMGNVYAAPKEERKKL